jgi:hypothetical protein
MRGLQTNVMSEETVRQWRRMFTDGRKNARDEERSGRASVVSDDLVQSERRRFTVSERSCEFTQISLTFLYVIIIVKLGYHNFCRRWDRNRGTSAFKSRYLAT